MKKKFYEQQNELKHYGVLGMHWGVRNEEKSGGSRKASSSSRTSSSFVRKTNAEVLRMHPSAHVVNHDAVLGNNLSDQQKENLKKALVGGAVVLTVAAGTALYLKNKTVVDRTVGSFLKQYGTKRPDQLSFKTRLNFGARGIFVKNEKDLVKHNMIASWIKSDADRYADISVAKYMAGDTDDVVVKAGNVMRRLTTNSGEVLRDGAYVSFHPDDVNRYRAFLPKMWKVNKFENFLKSKKAYEMTMTTVDDVKAPSFKKRIDAFADLLKNDPKFYNELNRYSLELQPKTDGQALVKALKDYKIFSGLHLLDRNSYAFKAYSEKIKAMGYNAIIDDNDAGTLSRAPMILLNAAAVKQGSVSELTKDLMKKASDSIVPMPGETTEATIEFLKKALLNAAYIKAYKLP